MPEGSEDKQQKHWWVKGYFKAKCPCGTSTKEKKSYACAWCKRAVWTLRQRCLLCWLNIQVHVDGMQVHAECQAKYVSPNEDCDMGELQRLILPSTSFRVAHLGMWVRCRMLRLARNDAPPLRSAPSRG